MSPEKDQRGFKRVKPGCSASVFNYLVKAHNKSCLITEKRKQRLKKLGVNIV